MNMRDAAVIAAIVPLLAGCGTVVEGSTQVISVNTVPVSGATCTVSNGAGSWAVDTPGSLTIDKSDDVLKIKCTKPGWQDGTFYAAGKMSTVSMVGSMLPYVGLLNTAVDASTGAALTYPDSYTVTMKPDTQHAADAAGAAPAGGN